MHVEFYFLAEEHQRLYIDKNLFNALKDKLTICVYDNLVPGADEGLKMTRSHLFLLHVN